MEFETAIRLKSAMSSDILISKKQPVRILTMASSGSNMNLSITQSMRKHINGIGIGKKDSGESFIKILTRTKSDLSPKKMALHFGIKSTDITIQEIGLIKPKISSYRFRPPYPGISVGHYKITAGTLGCFVKDKKNKIYLLSNNHVLANSNKAIIGDPILQPGKLDNGKRSIDQIAKLSNFRSIDFKNPNFMDAAIAELETAINPLYPLNKKVIINGQTNPRDKMKVEKFGRTTGHTKGRITTRNLDLKVDFDGKEVDFQDQFEVKAYGNIMFCDGGDSGSLIFESGTNLAVGLLFAGTDDGTTFGSPIDNILQVFSVNIL